MQLRNLTIPYAQPAVFAPMAGFTDAACRHLMADHGAAWTVSEMASAKAITFGDDKSVRLLWDKASHGIYAVQLFGAEPETMAQAIRIIQEKGVQFDILDINMGCPAPKITSSGAGSKLMQDPELCGRMVAAARGALGPDKPLTVKMRIGWDAEQLTGVAVARQCEANGADLIAVHGRTREQMYIPPIDTAAIAAIKQAVSVPVLANGDVTKMPAYNQKLEALLPVLDGTIPLKAHAHQANDIFTALRIAHEFGVRITLEHVTEGHLIADELAKEDVPMAVGPTLTHASKFELQNKSWTTPGVLAKAGCHVSIITDNSVIPQQYLPLCAGMAVKAGMDPFDALRAITLNAAEHIGVADRVGSLEVGKDADVVITDGSPFEVMTEVRAVFIDGEMIRA